MKRVIPPSASSSMTRSESSNPDLRRALGWAIDLDRHHPLFEPLVVLHRDAIERRSGHGLSGSDSLSGSTVEWAEASWWWLTEASWW